MKPYAIIAMVTFSLALAALAVHGTFAHAAEIKVLSTNGVRSDTSFPFPLERIEQHLLSLLETFIRMGGPTDGGIKTDTRNRMKFWQR
jgi:hypothetical protein